MKKEKMMVMAIGNSNDDDNYGNSDDGDGW